MYMIRVHGALAQETRPYVVNVHSATATRNLDKRIFQFSTHPCQASMSSRELPVAVYAWDKSNHSD